MSPEESSVTANIRGWVERANADPQRYLERQATEVLLTAIGQSPSYSERLYLKGGALMGIVYQSPRQTADIDFTAGFEPSDCIEADLRGALDPELQRAAARLGYPGLACRVQRMQRQPRRDRFLTANHPGLDLTIAYAERDTPLHERLLRSECPTVLKMEISFYEPVQAIEFVRFGPDAAARLCVYSLADLFGEKFRALLQQNVRGRYRRQDIYDIDFLVRERAPNAQERDAILAALLRKAQARGLDPRADSLSDPEVRRRAAAEWDTLDLELAELPDFDITYGNVEAFYRSLPW